MQSTQPLAAQADESQALAGPVPQPPDELASQALASDSASVAPIAPAPAVLAAADCALRMKQLWPALFVGAPKPLKLRIQVDIQERAPGTFTKQALSAFLRSYTGSTSYLQAVARGKQRFDLDGAPSGEISDAHRKVAIEELARRRANQESRRALEEQQRRNRAGLLHDFERTTLTRANFCALKEVAQDELDGLLAIARQEAVHYGIKQPRGPQHRGSDPRNSKSRT